MLVPQAVARTSETHETFYWPTDVELSTCQRHDRKTVREYIRQAQIDFAKFKVQFANDERAQRELRLFARVLDRRRCLWVHYVLHQHLAQNAALSQAFEHSVGVPGEILYDSMKVVLGEPEPDKPNVYSAKLRACRAHYGFVPRPT